MNQRKPNSSAWYSLGLGVLLCTAFLVISTGTAFARYRTERTKTVAFAVREIDRIVLGNWHTITEEEATDSLTAGTKVLQEQTMLPLENVDGTYRLTIVVGNGTSDADHSERDQRVQLRLVGPLGMLTDMEPAEMKLTMPSKEDPAVTETVQAFPIRIEDGTALDYTYGDGWVYTFQTEEGELTWDLPGDQFSYIELTITMGGISSVDAAALHPQVTAWVVE